MWEMCSYNGVMCSTGVFTSNPAAFSQYKQLVTVYLGLLVENLSGAPPPLPVLFLFISDYLVIYLIGEMTRQKIVSDSVVV